tara:strand:- start:1088 stop:1522 length:435 start_codon:yes stop_codon:yes gene_type:complete
MSEQKKENGKLKLTGFQRMCLEHALGVDYEYEEYEDRGRLTAEQCEDAHDWIHGKLMVPWIPGQTEPDWKPITITIPADMIEAVWYVLDNARDASVMLADGDMYENMRHENGTGDNMSEGLADSIIDRTSYAIWVKLEALKELI